ncbi:MAG: DUF3047 domain-containing protein [Deltaproteobacteria bacterium]|nr:MAG: DUF3047 domain-containing protein [Deltaproteobacteria bacterium]
MRRLCLFLLLCLIPSVSLADGDTNDQFTVPKGAVVIVSSWTLDGDTPKGFTKEVKEGVPGVALEGVFVKLTSKKTSFGFKKEVKLSVKDYPYVHWSWQARTLPTGGDVRKRETDDQAGQLYLLFPRFPAKLNTRILGYLWENETPKGTMGTSTAWSKAKYVVVRDKTDSLGTWHTESRNVYADYKKLFEEEPSDLGSVSVYINSQHTGSEAEVLFGPIYFTREP